MDESCSVWTLENEEKLLNAISNCGFGNWQDISFKVPPFTPSECEEHYMEVYGSDFTDDLRKKGLCSQNCKIEVEFKDSTTLNCANISEFNSFIRKLPIKEGDQSDTQHSTSKSSYSRFTNTVTFPIPGYNRMRSDFDIEYSNGAENILKMISNFKMRNVQFDKKESSLFSELEYTLYLIYNGQLEERRIRKKIIRDHCLLDRRKVFNTLQRLEVPFGTTTLKTLIPFMRFMNGPEFDYLIEKLKYQNELNLRKLLLMEYRQVGIRYLNEIKIYRKLNNKRIQYSQELQKIASRINIREGHQVIKKPSAPLALGNLPGVNLLSDEEKKLCSTYRIVPETYINFKDVLVAECEKHSGLRLAQARTLIKIDVNKTRKIYDYLISQNLIWVPES